MKIAIRGVPAFELTLSKRLVQTLMQCSELHYDSTCKAQSKVGGFIYGANNCVGLLEKDSVTVSWTWRQCDIACKIAEFPPTGLFSDEAMTELGDFRASLFYAFRTANEVSQAWHVDCEPIRKY